MPILKPIRAIRLNKSHPFACGLVGCWLFNEGGGEKVFDLSGNNNVGTLEADAHWVPGEHGSALSFDGDGDFVNCGTSLSLGVTTGLTLLMYLKPANLDDTIFPCARGFNYADKLGMCMQNSATTDNYLLWLGSGTDRQSLYTDAYSIKTDWQQVVYTWDGTTIRAYIDGVKQLGTTAFSGPIVYDNTLMMIGKGYFGAYFNGEIGHVMIWDHGLSEADVIHLHREPFCMFDLPIEPGLLYPAGQIVLLAAASTATSSAHGLLTKHSKLAGIIDTAATLSATLTWHYRGPVERQWLAETLFGGMTANAFKLGTVLTGGWFWMRRSGCSALYRGPSMEQIDFANILAVAEQDAGSISPPDYIPHHNHSTYFYVVRRFNICGYQECTLTAAVKVAIDANGNLIEPKPNNIFAWRLDQVYGNKIQPIWFYCPLEQESKPESFRIYYDGGTGHIDYENPIATVNYQGRKFYTYQSDALTAGRYLFAVRAEDAAGIENNSLAQLGIQLSTKSPDVINILSAEAV